MDASMIAGGVLVLAFVAAFVAQARRPGYHLYDDPGWLRRGAPWFLLTFALNGIVPAIAWFVVDAIREPGADDAVTVGAVVVAFLTLDLMQYLIHRAQHRSDLLWRFTHQFHHAAERVDVLGTYWLHPFEVLLMAGGTTLVSAVLGFGPNTVALAGLGSVLLGILQHCPIRTPVWLGYIVQRPEAHSIHHATGVHAHNYGNLALWDMIFRTRRDTVDFHAETGLYPGASERVSDLLLGRKVA